MNNPPLNVMVTGIGGGGHGEQILKALKLSDLNLNIIGGDMLATSKGLVEVDQPYILPAASHPDYLDCVLNLCKRHDVKALFHGSEPELNVMSRERERIEAAGLFLPINPASVIEQCMDKSRTVAFLKANGFHYPRSATIRTSADLEAVDFLPAVLKPSIGGGGSANLMLAQSHEELQMFGEYLLTIYQEFIIQEYVGTPDSEYTVGVLISMDGELLNSIAVKRTIMSALSNRIKVPNRTGRTELGKVLAVSSGISQGEIGRFPEVTQPCETIAMKLGCRGAVNLQCRYVDGKVYIFEINPRFSGTTSLRAMVGYNEPATLLKRHLLGQSIQAHFPFEEGHIMRGLHETYIANLDIPDALDLL